MLGAVDYQPTLLMHRSCTRHTNPCSIYSRLFICTLHSTANTAVLLLSGCLFISPHMVASSLRMFQQVFPFEFLLPIHPSCKLTIIIRSAREPFDSLKINPANVSASQAGAECVFVEQGGYCCPNPLVFCLLGSESGLLHRVSSCFLLGIHLFCVGLFPELHRAHECSECTSAQ